MATAVQTPRLSSWLKRVAARSDNVTKTLQQIDRRENAQRANAAASRNQANAIEQTITSLATRAQENREQAAADEAAADTLASQREAIEALTATYETEHPQVVSESTQTVQQAETDAQQAVAQAEAEVESRRRALAEAEKSLTETTASTQKAVASARTSASQAVENHTGAYRTSVARIAAPQVSSATEGVS